MLHSPVGRLYSKQCVTHCIKKIGEGMKDREMDTLIGGLEEFLFSVCVSIGSNKDVKALQDNGIFRIN